MIINPIIYDERGRGNDIFSKNLESRVIHLVGEVTDELAASITAQLLQLDSINHEDIYLYINSPGGSVSAGLAILDTMDYIESDVATICLGTAASMGAVLNQILSENCNKPLEQIEKDTDRDYWLNATSAVEYGIVDKVLKKNAS